LLSKSEYAGTERKLVMGDLLEAVLQAARCFIAPNTLLDIGLTERYNAEECLRYDK